MRHNRIALLMWVAVGIPFALSLLPAVIMERVRVGSVGDIQTLPELYETAITIGGGSDLLVFSSVLAVAFWLNKHSSLYYGIRRGRHTLDAASVAAVFSTFGDLTLPGVSAGDILSIETVGIVAVIAFGGIVIALALTSRNLLFDSDAKSESDDGANMSDVDAEKQIRSVDSGTLDRLERISPDPVQRVREKQFSEESVEGAETTLYRGIENAIADGKLDLSVRSRYGERYEIVNLPGRLREIELPMVDGRVHISEVEQQMRLWIEDDEIPIREIAYAIDAILDHRDDTERYVQNHEEEFEELRSDIETDVESIESITTGLGGTVGDRTRMLVLEDRHNALDGVGGIKERVSEAKLKLHRCSFSEATGQLRTIRSNTDNLLTAVDFIRSLVGGIEHGQQSAQIPNPPTEQLYTELEPLLEQQYEIKLSLENGRLSIETSGTNETQNSSPPASGKEPDRTHSDRHINNTVEPEKAADEILYTLRELKRARVTGNTIEYQTEQLPDSIATPELLAALAVFCQRQTNIVAEVTLQENAPPGFLEIQFTETTGATSGINELIDRFVDRYGSADR